MLLQACDPHLVYENNKKVTADGWRSKDIMKFNVDIPDSNLLYNFYINLRVSRDYRYANIFLFLRTLYPDGEMSQDTIECFLADVDGRWLGKSSGSIIDNRIMLRKNMNFNQSGSFSFEFEQAMRDTVLPHVEDFGIRIEKAQP